MKINLIPIELHQVRDYVKRAFENDIELLERYHISPGTLDHCVDHTMDFINRNVDHYKGDMKLFAVQFGGIIIGYTILIQNEKTPNELYSFGININYRKPEILKAWLKEIEEILGKTYFVALWSKNERAVNFFLKNEFKLDKVTHYLNEEIKILVTS